MSELADIDFNDLFSALLTDRMGLNRQFGLLGLWNLWSFWSPSRTTTGRTVRGASSWDTDTDRRRAVPFAAVSAGFVWWALLEADFLIDTPRFCSCCLALARSSLTLSAASMRGRLTARCALDGLFMIVVDFVVAMADRITMLELFDDWWGGWVLSCSQSWRCCCCCCTTMEVDDREESCFILSFENFCCVDL